MTIGKHVTQFAGLPCFPFEEGEPLPADDHPPIAWRVESWEEDMGDWEEGRPSPTFRQEFESFLDTVDPATVTALVIGSWGYAAFNIAPIEQLCAAASRLTNLRALFLGDITYEECEISWIKQGDLTPLLAAYPDLEVLRVRGTDGLELTPVRHTALRELAFESGGLPATVVRAVGECDLPALEHLELWLGSSYYQGDATVADLAPILAGTRLPALRHLGLRDAEITDEIAAELGTAPVVARLDTLDLSMGALGDEGVAALLAGQPLTHLRRLDLHHHFVGEESAARLTAALPNVEVDLSDPQQPDGDGDRYVAVSE
ncbi:STM4015 family protein [Micromonospora sonneratiae]|uniref:STM4015 family protein n=1 Tax=Micromonospora sonneratiae TaxID=1184706 RepID=A0ABW3YFM1_9ACTN